MLSGDKMVLVVAAALVADDGKVLVQRRPAGKPMAGLWEFPGGKVEADELPEAALARELEEELGIGVEAAALSPCAFASESLGSKQLLLLLYTLRRWEGEPAARHADVLEWVYPADLRDLAMPPADVPLIGLLERLL